MKECFVFDGYLAALGLDMVIAGRWKPLDKRDEVSGNKGRSVCLPVTGVLIEYSTRVMTMGPPSAARALVTKGVKKT